MFNFVEALEKEGPVGKILPTKPRKDLAWLLNEKRKSSKLLTNTELHEYLADNIVGTNESVSCLQVTGVNLRTLEDALTYLKPGYVLLRRSNNANLCVCIDYGEWLNAVFELHYREKRAGRVWRSWKEWIEEEVGIQDSYARKLRDVAKLLRNYPRFKTLGISFSGVYRRRRQIQNMLVMDRQVAEFWRSTASNNNGVSTSVPAGTFLLDHCQQLGPSLFRVCEHSRRGPC